MIIQHLVTAIQFSPKPREVLQNLKVATQMVYEAASKGAKVIVLPELCLSSNALMNRAEAAMCAQTRDGYQTSTFTQLANKFNCYIVFGYVELYNDQLYNSAAIVGPQGLSGNFQKHNLQGTDFLWAEASESLFQSVITPWGRIGVLIDRDVMNKQRDSHPFKNEKTRYYYPGMLDILCVLTNWSSESGYPDSDWVELVESLGANVIVANQVGKSAGVEYKGGSCIIDRTMQVWSHGSSFNDSCVVGGYAIIGE